MSVGARTPPPSSPHPSPGGVWRHRRSNEIFVSVLTGQATQREAAAKWKVDRSTVTHICRVAKQGALDALSASVAGRRGMTAEAAGLAAAREEIKRLRATVTEQAVALHLHQGNPAGIDGWPGPGPG